MRYTIITSDMKDEASNSLLLVLWDPCSHALTTMRNGIQYWCPVSTNHRTPSRVLAPTGFQRRCEER
jgi:hypothetical protein